MPARPIGSPLAVLAVGTVVFGGAVAWLARSGSRDPRIALAGLLAALTLTVALLLMVWARRRAGARPVGTAASRVARGVPPAEPRLTVVDLGRGQAAVIFDEPEARAGAGSRPSPSPLSPAREAELSAAAIFEAVTAAVAAAEPSPRHPPGPGRLSWRRLGLGRGRRP